MTQSKKLKPQAALTLVGKLWSRVNPKPDGAGVFVTGNLSTSIREKNADDVYETKEAQYHDLVPMGKAVADSIRFFPEDKIALVTGVPRLRNYEVKGEKRSTVEVLVFTPIEATDDERLNHIAIRGNLGRKPSIYVSHGETYAQLTLAVNRSYRGKVKKPTASGGTELVTDWVTETTWFTLDLDDPADVEKAKTLSKGNMVFAEGELITEKNGHKQKPVVRVTPGSLLTPSEELDESRQEQERSRQEEEAALDAPFDLSDLPNTPPRFDFDEQNYDESNSAVNG